jgi:peptidoglycan/LPS O-acetylase OafA/YrhL
MKRHFEVLDGLRGVAALLVVCFHIFQVHFPSPFDNPLHHAYLAVDFFFLLSGFVIGYAYDDRWPQMTIKDFLKLRIIRLHPLVIFSILVGAFLYLKDPFYPNQQQVGDFRFTVVIVLGMLLIPSPSLPNHHNETHPLNGPCWSLLQEYLVNMIYALVAPRLRQRTLIKIVIISGLALACTALWNGDLQGGWGWTNCWMAPIRVAFPFFTGLLLFRMRTVFSVPRAFPLLSLLLLVIFALPHFKYNGFYEAVCVLFIFPLLIAAGAGARAGGWMAGLCRFLGQLSYPLYITHYPFIYLYMHWVAERHPSGRLTLEVGAALAVFLVLFAWLTLRLYDEPFRKWIGSYGRKWYNALR